MPPLILTPPLTSVLQRRLWKNAKTGNFKWEQTQMTALATVVSLCVKHDSLLATLTPHPETERITLQIEGYSP